MADTGMPYTIEMILIFLIDRDNMAHISDNANSGYWYKSIDT